MVRGLAAGREPGREPGGRHLTLLSAQPEPRVVELEAQPSAAVRLQQPLAELDLASAFGRYLPVVFGSLGSIGAAPAGAPYGRYRAFGPEAVDVEIGVPTAETGDLPPLGSRAPGEVGASELPAGAAAVLVHLGPYDTLPQGYERLQAWIEEHGRTPGAGPWESYVDDPGEVADAMQLRTEIVWPLV